MIRHRHLNVRHTSTGIRLLGKDEIQMYVFGGKGRFILKSSSGVSHEYRVKPMTKLMFNGRCNIPNPNFNEDILYICVKDNGSFIYIGHINMEDNKFYLSKKSPFKEEQPQIKGIKWLLHQFEIEKEFPETMEFYHMGICGCCGKNLTTEGSIKMGIGPICFERYGNERLKKLLHLKKRLEQKMKKNNIVL